MSKGSSRGPKWEALRKAVLERDGYICQHCGQEATEADHVVPKALGGRDEMSNLVASCKPCNTKKGATPLLRTSGFNPRWLDGLW